MSDSTPTINGTEPAPLPPQPGIGIAPVAVELAPNATYFEIKLRDPGIVRAVGFWLREPKVVMSALKGVEKVPQPLLFVECDPSREVRDRRFIFAPSDHIISPKPGYEARWCGTALDPRGMVAHLFELVAVPS